jgi:hypothetical protein
MIRLTSIRSKILAVTALLPSVAVGVVTYAVLQVEAARAVRQS